MSTRPISLDRSLFIDMMAKRPTLLLALSSGQTLRTSAVIARWTGAGLPSLSFPKETEEEEENEERIACAAAALNYDRQFRSLGHQ